MHPPPHRDADSFPGLEEDLGASWAPRTPAMDGDDYITAAGQGRASSEHSLLLDAARGLASTAQSPLPGSPTSLQGGGLRGRVLGWGGPGRGARLAPGGSRGQPAEGGFTSLSRTARPTGPSNLSLALGAHRGGAGGAGDGVAQGQKLGKVLGPARGGGEGQGRDSYPDRAPAFPTEGLEKLSRRLGLGCKARSPPSRDTKLGSGGESATPGGGASGGLEAMSPGRGFAALSPRSAPPPPPPALRFLLPAQPRRLRPPSPLPRGRDAEVGTPGAGGTAHPTPSAV